MDILSLFNDHVVQNTMHLIIIHYLKTALVKSMDIKFVLVVDQHDFEVLVLSGKVKHLMEQYEIEELFFFTTVGIDDLLVLS